MWFWGLRPQSGVPLLLMFLKRGSLARHMWCFVQLSSLQREKASALEQSLFRSSFGQSANKIDLSYIFLIIRLHIVFVTMLGTKNRPPIVAGLAGFMNSLTPKAGSVCPHCACEFRLPTFPNSALWQITLGSFWEVCLRWCCHVIGKTGKTQRCGYEPGTHLSPEVKGTAEVYSSVVVAVLHNVFGLSKEAAQIVSKCKTQCRETEESSATVLTLVAFYSCLSNQ